MYVCTEPRPNQADRHLLCPSLQRSRSRSSPRTLAGSSVYIQSVLSILCFIHLAFVVLTTGDRRHLHHGPTPGTQHHHHTTYNTTSAKTHHNHNHHHHPPPPPWAEPSFLLPPRPPIPVDPRRSTSPVRKQPAPSQPPPKGLLRSSNTPPNRPTLSVAGATLGLPPASLPTPPPCDAAEYPSSTVPPRFKPLRKLP